MIASASSNRPCTWRIRPRRLAGKAAAAVFGPASRSAQIHRLEIAALRRADPELLELDQPLQAAPINGGEDDPSVLVAPRGDPRHGIEAAQIAGLPIGEQSDIGGDIGRPGLGSPVHGGFSDRERAQTVVLQRRGQGSKGASSSRLSFTRSAPSPTPACHSICESSSDASSKRMMDVSPQAVAGMQVRLRAPVRPGKAAAQGSSVSRSPFVASAIAQVSIQLIALSASPATAVRAGPPRSRVPGGCKPAIGPPMQLARLVAQLGFEPLPKMPANRP